jgi:hypothetical protein
LTHRSAALIWSKVDVHVMARSLLVLALFAGIAACSSPPCDGPCSVGFKCVSGRCRLPCTADAECDEHEVCYRGFCELGDRRPEAELQEGAGADSGDPDGVADGGDAGGDANGDETALAICGDDVADADEACDGIDLKDVVTCADLYFGTGTPTCMPTCAAFDLSACSGPSGGGCNGSVATNWEQCDGSDLRNRTCESLGYAGGVLSCNTNCSLNVSACVP